MPLEFVKSQKSRRPTKRELLIGFSAILAICVSLIFPQKAYGETFWLSFFLFVIFPAAATGFLLKEPLQNFGLSRGKPQTGIIFSLVVSAIFIFANYYILFHSGYGGQLSIARGILGSFIAFAAFEIFIALPLHFFWEFFFRGFIQMGLENKLGTFSLFLATILQTLFFFRSGWITISFVFFSSLGAGVIVRQSRSILYSAFSLWIISVSLDIMIIRIAHQIVR